MKDIVDNRQLISLSEKLSIARLAYSQNGLRWCTAFGVYYLASALSNRAFSRMDRIRRRDGVPGLNSLELNRAIWKSWDWQGGAGEEWSLDEAWKQSIVHAFIEKHVPAGSSVLEIGPGGGRWTVPLLERASSYVGVDISPSCVEACKSPEASVSGKPSMSARSSTAGPGLVPSRRYNKPCPPTPSAMGSSP